jgi:hemolysin III
VGTYRDYTEREELLNAGTHGMALLFYLFAGPYLIYKGIQQTTPVNIAGLVIYAIGLVAVFATSTCYHAINDRVLKTKLRTLDHMAIFLLIGGTYTPVINKFIENPLGTIFLTILWIILIGGMVMKFFFMGRFKAFSIGLYIFLGCMVLLLINPILKSMPKDILIFIALGGLSYLLGVIFYTNKKREFMHTIWHIFVMLASFFHFIAIFKTAVVC